MVYLVSLIVHCCSNIGHAGAVIWTTLPGTLLVGSLASVSPSILLIFLWLSPLFSGSFLFLLWFVFSCFWSTLLWFLCLVPLLPFVTFVFLFLFHLLCLVSLSSIVVFLFSLLSFVSLSPVFVLFLFLFVLFHSLSWRSCDSVQDTDIFR